MNKLQKLRILLNKEFSYILSDKRTLIISIIMSVVLFPALFLGISAIENYQQDRAQTITTTIGVDNEDKDNTFVTLLKESENFEVEVVDDGFNELEEDRIFGILEINPDAEQDSQAVKFTYVYNEASNDSVGSSTQIQAAFEQFLAITQERQLAQYQLSLFELAPYTFESDTLQARTGSASSGSLLGFLLPYFILLSLVQGSVQYAIEITTGEKERNTLATTLSMNADPSLIAVAKIIVTLTLSLFFLMLNIGSILIAFSLPAMQSQTLDISLGFETIMQLAIIMLPLSFLTSGVMILLGIYARNQKEAQTYALPFTIIAMFIAFAGTLFDVSTPLPVFFAPLIGHVAAIRQIIFGSFIPLNVVAVTFSTIVLFALTVYIVTTLFKKEGVLFRV